MQPTQFLGLRTVVYHVQDLPSARSWYADLLGVPPYFDEPFYVGFNVAGFELGLLPIESEANGNDLGTGKSVAYWGVPDARATVDRLIQLGAVLQGEIQDVGEGILVADVLDPFGNRLGVIENRHFPNQAEPKV